MRKIIICLLFISMMLSVFTGCRKEEPKVLAVSSPILYDFTCAPMPSGMLDEEYYERQKRTPDTPSESATVEFNGKSYTGTYKRADEIGDSPYWEYQYEGYEDGKKYWFSIASDTGRLCDFDWTAYEVDESVEKLSVDECRAIADALLKKQNRSGFTLEKQSERETDYSFRYVREVYGMATTEFVSIWVSFDGTVYSYTECYFADFDRAWDFSKVNSDTVAEALQPKLDAMVARVEGELVSYRFEAPTYQLTVLQDGSLGLECDVKMADIVWTDKERYHFKELHFIYMIPLLVEEN